MTTRANLYVDQGVDYLADLEIFTNTEEQFPVDEKTFTCQVRKLYSTQLAFEADVQVLVDGDDINNVIELFISADKTANLEPGKYVYDIIMEDEGVFVFKVLEGLMTILPTITRQ